MDLSQVNFSFEAVLPGYGFLAENADFAKALEAEGVKFCGPSVECLDIFGDKHKVTSK